VKTFAGEAASQLDFLKDGYGFAGTEVERGASPGTAVSVRYRRGDVTIEASLVLWHVGKTTWPPSGLSTRPMARCDAPSWPGTRPTPAARCAGHSGCIDKHCTPRWMPGPAAAMLRIRCPAALSHFFRLLTYPRDASNAANTSSCDLPQTL
jgi:hypothetical protein